MTIDLLYVDDRTCMEVLAPYLVTQRKVRRSALTLKRRAQQAAEHTGLFCTPILSRVSGTLGQQSVHDRINCGEAVYSKTIHFSTAVFPVHHRWRCSSLSLVPRPFGWHMASNQNKQYLLASATNVLEICALTTLGVDKSALIRNTTEYIYHTRAPALMSPIDILCCIACDSPISSNTPWTNGTWTEHIRIYYISLRQERAIVCEFYNVDQDDDDDDGMAMMMLLALALPTRFLRSRIRLVQWEWKCFNFLYTLWQIGIQQ